MGTLGLLRLIAGARASLVATGDERANGHPPRACPLLSPPALPPARTVPPPRPHPNQPPVPVVSLS
jgi:hypothetical protein